MGHTKEFIVHDTRQCSVVEMHRLIVPESAKLCWITGDITWVTSWSACASPRLVCTGCPPPPGTSRSGPRRQTRSQGPEINCKSIFVLSNCLWRPIMRTERTCFVVCSPRNRGGTNSLKNKHPSLPGCWCVAADL